MKRSTAVGHLVEMAEVATERLRFRTPTSVGPWRNCGSPDLLSPADTLEMGAVVLILDLPVDEVPWLAVNNSGEWVGARLRLGKRPMSWCYRPRLWPAWNVAHRRLARFWSADSGLDTGDRSTQIPAARPADCRRALRRGAC